MVPHDLAPRIITLPETDNPTIALITGKALRHQRFAYRMQQEFGERVVAWYQIQPKVSREGEKINSKRQISPVNLIKKLTRHSTNIPQTLKYVKAYGVSKTVYKSLLKGIGLIEQCLVSGQNREERQEVCESRLFAKEIAEFRQIAHLEPIPVQNPNSPAFVAILRALSPYFFLSLGGPLYKPEVLASCRGIALNQHAGWAPDYKGTGTTYWALYHRRLDYVGSTVHITTSGADTGQILRRSHPCLLPDDTPETCFARVVALGTELMIEVVKEIIEQKKIIAYDQPITVGKTFRGVDFHRSIQQAIYRDFSQRWLAQELDQIKHF